MTFEGDIWGFFEHTSKSYGEYLGNPPPDEFFKCKMCGKKFIFHFYGSFPIGYSPEKEAKEILKEHLEFIHKDEYLDFYKNNILKGINAEKN